MNQAIIFEVFDELLKLISTWDTENIGISNHLMNLIQETGQKAEQAMIHYPKK